MHCFDAAASASAGRNASAAPGSMSDGDWLIGWGCASTLYPTQIAPPARVFLRRTACAGETAAHEIGNGASTVIGMIAAEELGLPVENVMVELGDTELPPAPSPAAPTPPRAFSTSSPRPARTSPHSRRRPSPTGRGRLPARRRTACAFGRTARGGGSVEDLDRRCAASPRGVEAYAENVPQGAEPNGVECSTKGARILGGAKMRTASIRLRGRIRRGPRAQLTREIRVPRVVGAFAAGRIVNPLTARSQLMGGLIWGVSSALFEATDIDRETARYVNTDLADYLIPVNADAREVEVCCRRRRIRW